jgi:hypothetical protein
LSIKFENSIISALDGLDSSSLRISFESHRIFLCGGEVNGGAKIPPSFRDRFVSYTQMNYEDISRSLVLAESFKDYFKDNAYPDLLVFEDEIANISSLVILFLESPGSLVELGMFCTKPDFYKKLVIIAPQSEIKSEDSFIFLGPLENIRKKESNSVFVYPWPSASESKFDTSHLYDLSETVKEKLSAIPKSQRFNSRNSGHIAFLTCEIISICFPILVSEIELALLTFNIEISTSEINRQIYLLEKLKLISLYPYSGNKYYFPTNKSNTLVKISKAPTFDKQKVRMSIMQSFLLEEDISSRKRRSALNEINKISQDRINESS